MREAEIKLFGRYNLSETAVYIDGTPVSFKRCDNGDAVCNYRTDSDRINVKIYRQLDVGGTLWFVVQLLFFVISIFGIFDIHFKERCLVIDHETEIDLKDNSKIAFKLNIPKENERAVEIQADTEYREISNKYYTDDKAKKTLKYLKWAKLILAAAIIVTAIAVLLTVL